MIQLQGVSVRSGAFAISDVSLSVDQGQYAVLMGRTGSGKTTLLEAISGLRPITAGRIVLHGRDVTTLKPSQRDVGYVPQDRALFPKMTVAQHLSFALEIRGRKWGTTPFSSPAAPAVDRKWGRTPSSPFEDAVAARIGELAQLLGLAALLDRGVTNLSGGEAQRVALGRALSHSPPILLLDEPLTALDEETRGEMCDLLESVRRQTGVTVLHVTHNPAEAGRLADRVFRIDNGIVREEAR
jgi:ABC-type sugar transport system ATPase subunit